MTGKGESLEELGMEGEGMCCVGAVNREEGHEPLHVG